MKLLMISAIFALAVSCAGSYGPSVYSSSSVQYVPPPEYNRGQDQDYSYTRSSPESGFTYGHIHQYPDGHYTQWDSENGFSFGNVHQ